MRKPSPAVLVSSAALLVALGGTSYAAAQINGSQLKNGTVTSAKIKNQTIQSRDIANGTVKAKDLKPGVLPTGSRWALVNAQGQIEAQSGGFSVVAAYPTLPNTLTPPADNSLRANGNVYINAGEPLANNAITATVVLQNTVDQNTDAITSGRAPGDDSNPEFSGEISVSQCGTPITACAPPGAAVNNVFVVSPRLSNGSFTGTDTRKRFYVVIVGDSSDRTS
ncbi:hypothetical protein G5V58_23965 [Nocardioides anomalus]|uniref:Uncharacterized protein n=1 Tax=Nocardioides anomalus TaxID=2712223 RepID=A0A6G6WJR4_9ACTN|nr:hypothetical protein [Nocardioides anomalus]QIG45397.1 hypothetical protein G5V58_23965 [Nocardioides anomalus]